jgi:hypothetical protein
MYSKTLENIMFMVDGIYPNGGGLGYKPNLDRFNVINGGMIGGMANYNNKGKIVSQTLEDGKLVNYELSDDSIEKNIMKNDKLDDIEKIHKLQTEYIELLNLRKIYKDDINIVNIIHSVEKKIDKLNENRTDKIMGKNDREQWEEFIKEKEFGNKIYKESNLSEDDINTISKEFIDVINKKKDVNNNEKLDKLILDIFGNDMMQKDLDDLYDNVIKKNLDSKENLEKELKFFLKNKVDVIRGNKSEDKILNKESPQDRLLKNFTGDNTTIYNSKDDDAYHSEFFSKLKIFLSDKIDGFNDNLFDEIKKNYKKFYPIDGISDKGFYELKSRDKDVFNNKGKAYYGLTKLIGGSRYIEFTSKNKKYKLAVKEDLEYQKTKEKKIKGITANFVLMEGDKELGRKELPTLKQKGRELSWIEHNENGVINYNPLDYNNDAIDYFGKENFKKYLRGYFRDKLGKNKPSLEFYNTIKFSDETLKNGVMTKKDVNNIKNQLGHFNIDQKESNKILNSYKPLVSEKHKDEHGVQFKYNKGIISTPIQTRAQNLSDEEFYNRTYNIKHRNKKL